MPWGNRTGPWGMGPMTGRAMGYCAGYPAPGYFNPAGGWGYVPGPGRGLAGFRGHGGRGRFFAGWAPRWGGAWYGTSGAGLPFSPVPGTSPPKEIEVLKEQAAYFEEALSDIMKRISELESRPGKE